MMGMRLHVGRNSGRRLDRLGGRLALRSLRVGGSVGRCLALRLCLCGSGLGDLATFSKRSDVCY